MKTIRVKDFLKATPEAIKDLESNAGDLGFFEFPHGNFKKIEQFEQKLERWENWTSQLSRLEAGAALDLSPEAFASLLERIENDTL